MCVIDHGRISVIGTPDEMKRQLLDRSVLLDAADRPALDAELRRLGLAPAIDAADRARPRRLRRRHRPGAHRPDRHAAVGPAGPRTQPRGGLRGAPPHSPEEAVA